MSDPEQTIDEMDWRERLELVTGTMRDMSREADPAAVVDLYTERMARMVQYDRMLSLSRRGVDPPEFVVARCSDWDTVPDPWKERERLPVLEGGLLGALVGGERPALIERLDAAEDDPGREYLREMAGARSRNRSAAIFPVGVQRISTSTPTEIELRDVTGKASATTTAAAAPSGPARQARQRAQ